MTCTAPTIEVIGDRGVTTADPARVLWIGPGDVQWMTAGAGILHEEFHSQAFAKSGGTLDMVQLWVNLPAKDKMTMPSYQTPLRQDIPLIELPDGSPPASPRTRTISAAYQDGNAESS
jgi:quercetin 2,3-dioxygenase